MSSTPGFDPGQLKTEPALTTRRKKFSVAKRPHVASESDSDTEPVHKEARPSDSDAAILQLLNEGPAGGQERENNANIETNFGDATARAAAKVLADYFRIKGFEVSGRWVDLIMDSIAQGKDGSNGSDRQDTTNDLASSATLRAIAAALVKLDRKVESMASGKSTENGAPTSYATRAKAAAASVQPSPSASSASSSSPSSSPSSSSSLTSSLICASAAIAASRIARCA